MKIDNNRRLCTILTEVDMFFWKNKDSQEEDFSAERMSEISKSSLKELLRREIKSLEEEIKKQASNGNFYATKTVECSPSMKEQIVDFFEERGFTVQTSELQYSPMENISFVYFTVYWNKKIFDNCFLNMI